MMAQHKPFFRWIHSGTTIWQQCWFYGSDTLSLEVIRIGLAFILFINYTSFSLEELKFFYTDMGILPINFNENYLILGRFSLLYYTTSLWQFYLFYSVFLFACFCLIIGWHTSLVKWLVLAGQISFLYRCPLIYYGLDCLSCNLLLILCFAPIGTSLSLDRARYLRRLKHKYGIESWQPPPKGPWTSACIRLMQLQMAIAFFYAGIYKIQGVAWGSGEAVWLALTHAEFNNISLILFSKYFWIVNLLTYYTLFLELSYPFLIWERKTRPFYLIGAILLHLGIATMMGLYLFSGMMIFGHLSFVPRQWYRSLKLKYKNLILPIEIIYDGHCNFCLHSMIFLLSFDGFNQCCYRNYRTNPSPLLKEEDQDKEIHIISNNAILSGFDAYRYLVLHIPGLWWLVPAFYIPFLSKFVGRPLYRWIASRRASISVCFINHSLIKEQDIE
ncbi:MAG: DUF393 domain-containing protein [Proteobacteria bacterium]|nr:DUF393 domain-containing protein [Pseudomonadota bacterium]